MNKLRNLLGVATSFFYTSLFVLACASTLFLSVCSTASTGNDDKSPLTIAVASNFSATMHALVDDYRRISAQPVRIVQGSSGKLFAQIRYGAPFDLFFSADQQKPAALVKANLAIASSQRTYAQGRLVLWQPNATGGDDNKSRVGEQTLHSLAQLSNTDKLAIANPKHAPYGQAAQALMHSLGIQAGLTKQLVYGENVAQAFQFAERRAVPFALVALAQVINDITANQWWLVPSEMHSPILQDCVIVRRTPKLAQAQAFLDYLNTESAEAIVQQYGYQTAVDE